MADRFIPVRSAIDWDWARAEFSWSQQPSSSSSSSSSSSAYGELLRIVLLNGNGRRRRILEFNCKKSSSSSSRDGYGDSIANPNAKAKARTHLVTDRTADRVLDAPGFVHDPSLNLLDWGANDLIAVALENNVHLWNAASISELVTVNDDEGPVTSVRWAENGQRIAVGLSNSDVQLWDVTPSGCNLLRTLKNLHLDSRIGSIDWNRNLLTTGGADGRILTSDVRLPSPVVHSYSYRGGRNNEICALKWSNSGGQLASGASDGLVRIWDAASASSLSKPSHVFGTGAGSSFSARAFAWSPFGNDLLATAGKGTINFWNTRSGTLVNSSTGNRSVSSQVSALLWNKHNQKEILGSSGNGNITLWEYPSMSMKARFVGHENSVLSLCQSPDGCSVASVSGGMDESHETLRIWWDVFPPVPKPAATERPFSNFSCTQIR